MTQEYPKMLYSPDSDTVNHSGRIVHDEVDEQEWRERGFVDYVDLPEPQPEETPVAGGSTETPVGFVTTEQFDAVAERLANAEAEIERLKQGSNTETFVPEVKYAEGMGVGSTSTEMSTSTELNAVAEPMDYNDLTIPQLQAVLDEKGIEYLARDSKATLIGLLENSGS